MISRFAACRTHTTSPQRALVCLALLAYVVVGAIVPQGHMAAPISSGTLFHFCPGDLRSAQIIDAMAMSGGGQHQHHHHHGHHDQGGVNKTAADPGCTFAGFGTAVGELPGEPFDGMVLASVPALRQPAPVTISIAWVRPPIRTPPT